MRVNRMIVALVAVVVVGGLMAGPAAALEPGVSVDPTSPSGKEYSFPLDVQRGAAVGSDAPQGAAEPLFGVGITPAGGGTGTGAGSSHGSGTGAAGRHGTSSTPASKRAAKRAAAARRRSGQISRQDLAGVQSLAQPGSTFTQIALIVVAVVLGGLLVGAAAVAAARRQQRSRS